jgi:Zn-dependent peptidase ImmA (M78 family)
VTTLHSNQTVLDQVRALAPDHTLTQCEAYELAERQAALLLRLLDITGPHVSYDGLLDLPNIEVRPEPKYRMHHAGMSRYRDGKWLILVDKNDVHGRRRYTLAHELKHVIDDPMERTLYAELGYGDPHEQERQIEALCQYFAACFLMPREWVTAAWLNGIRDVYNLASLFQVSASAMHIRLRYLGMWENGTHRDVRTFFRPVYPYSRHSRKKHLLDRA